MQLAIFSATRRFSSEMLWNCGINLPSILPVPPASYVDGESYAENHDQIEHPNVWLERSASLSAGTMNPPQNIECRGRPGVEGSCHFS